MAATLGVDTIQHTNGTTAVTVGTNGSVTAAGTLAVTGVTTLTGNVGIGTSSPTTPNSGSSLDVTGPILSGGAIATHQTNAGVFQYSVNETMIRSYGGTAGSGKIIFKTGGGGGSADSEAMRIDSSGNTMVGRSSAQARFSIGGASATAASSTICRIGDADYTSDTVLSVAPGVVSFDAPGVAGGRMKIDASGDLFVQRIYDNATSGGGNVRVQSNGLLQRDTSSRRYKNTIEDATHGLAELLTLRTVTYKGNNDGDTVFGGLIAEEVHDSGLTEFVSYNDEGEPEALAYGNMVSLCIKAIQELSAKNDSLEARLAALET